MKAAYLRLCVLILAVLVSTCSVKVSQSVRDYNDQVNRQFWTADWSADDKYIAVGGVDSILRIYHGNDLSLYKSFPMNSWIHVVKWHPDSKMLAIATLDKYVQLLTVETGTVIPLTNKGGSRAIDWNYDGELLAVGELDGLIKIWDKTGKLVKGISKTYPTDAVGKSFLALDWHPTKNIFVATNFQIGLFDTSGAELRTMEHQNKAAIILCVDWHPSGEFFVLGDYGHNWEGENVPSLLHFWSEDGKYIKSISGSKREYRNITWNRDGSKLATASDVLRVWSKDGMLLKTAKSDSTNYLWGIDWNTKGNRIVTSSRFKTVALWDNNGLLIKRLDVQ